MQAHMMNRVVHSVGQRPPGDTLRASMFPAPSLKFRTAGFPQYGFKLEFDRDLRHDAYTRSRARISESYSPSGQSSGLLLRSDPVQRPLAPRRGIVSRWLLAYYGLIRATPGRPSAYLLRRTGFIAKSGSPLLSATLSRRA